MVPEKMKKVLPSSVFVLGGASSGKSLWAEGLVETYAKPKVYVATGRSLDEETAARVQAHKDRRGTDWQTVEAPLDLGPALGEVTSDQVVLIDCATMWLTNHMMAERNLAAAQDALLSALQSCAAPWVMVSNEVGQGIVPENQLARRFRVAQGQLNVALAAQAELVVQVIAGLPQVLKGKLP